MKKTSMEEKLKNFEEKHGELSTKNKEKLKLQLNILNFFVGTFIVIAALAFTSIFIKKMEGESFLSAIIVSCILLVAILILHLLLSKLDETLKLIEYKEKRDKEKPKYKK